MLRFAYPDIPCDPYILLWGGGDDFRQLAELLRSVPSLPSEVALVDCGCHAQTGDTVLLVPCGDAARGMTRVAAAEKTYRWQIDQHHGSTFAAMLDSVASAKEGHHYLETGSANEITVKASIGEYPDDFLID